MDKIIIEARVNELAPRGENPNVPFLPAEIVSDAKACFDEGASILHYHGRTADGAPDHGPACYLETNAGIREVCSILIHPTLGYVANDADAMGRFAAIEEMMKDPKTAPDFAPMDVGSVNVDWWNPGETKFDTTDLIYKNSTETLLHFAERIKHHNLKHYLVSWNVSFTRQIEAFLKMGVIPEPAHILIVLTDGIMLAGHPGTPEGLDAQTTFMPKEHRASWTVSNYKGDLLLLTEKIIKDGGHISIGLGDYPYTEYGENGCAPSNADIIARVVAQARALGREPATVEETRAMLKMGQSGIAS
ncbi:MAG: 3-keto-5-aminohexanoate cleavage enzyme [Hyphomicrobiaceae bacterium]|jgi:3-keto-5-aminohexanoate cleavage enzyme